MEEKQRCIRMEAAGEDTHTQNERRKKNRSMK